jgi:hypothetical protein
MLKPLTLSLSLAVALGMCSVSMAGLHDGGCTTCGLASPQGVVASPQSTSVGCGETVCKPKHQWGSGLKKLCDSFQHSVSYEWVLKKKHNWSFGHGSSGCSTCGTAAPIYPTGQHVAPTSQTVASGQYSAPTAYGAGQHTFVPARTATTIASVPAEMTPTAPGGEEVPPAPEVRGSSAIGSSNGLLLPTPSGN